jgi:hypothetical protein
MSKKILIRLMLAIVAAVHCTEISAGEPSDAGRLSSDVGSPVDGGPVLINVDCGRVVNTMRGGMGASWHAMEAPIPYGVEHPLFKS